MSSIKTLSPYMSIVVAGIIGFQSFAIGQTSQEEVMAPLPRVVNPILTPAQRQAHIDATNEQIKKIVESAGLTLKDTVAAGKNLRDATQEFDLQAAMRIAKTTLPATVAEIHKGITQVSDLITQLRELRATTKGDFMLECSVYAQILLSGLTNLTLQLHLTKSHMATLHFNVTVALMWANIYNNHKIKGEKLGKLTPEAMKASLLDLASELTKNGFDDSQIGKASSFVTQLSASLTTEKSNILGMDVIGGMNELGPKGQIIIAGVATFYGVLLMIPATHNLAERRIAMFQKMAIGLKGSANKVEDLAGKAKNFKKSAHAGVGLSVGGVDLGDIAFGMSTTKGVAMIDQVEAQLLKARNDLIASLQPKKE